MTTLCASHLKKRYRSRQAVQESASRWTRGEEVVGLLWTRDGAGETTCFYLIRGADPQRSRRIELNGQDLTQRPMHARARAGLSYLAQEARYSVMLRPGRTSWRSWRRGATSTAPGTGALRALLEGWACPVWAPASLALSVCPGAAATPGDHPGTGRTGG